MPNGGWVTITVRRLEDDVRGALVRADLEPATSGALDVVPDEEVGMKDRQIGARKIGARREKETATLSFDMPPESARLFRAVLEEVRERLSARHGAPATEGDAFEAMLDHAIQAWTQDDPHARREYRIFERDGWLCGSPLHGLRRRKAPARRLR